MADPTLQEQIEAVERRVGDLGRLIRISCNEVDDTAHKAYVSEQDAFTAILRRLRLVASARERRQGDIWRG